MRIIRISAVIIVFALGLAAVGAPIAAQAVAEEPLDGVNQQVEPPQELEQPVARLATTVVDSGTGTDEAPSAFITRRVESPSGCTGISDNPHRSVHYPDRVAAQSRTECGNTVVPRIGVDNQLAERRWFGWDTVGTRGSAHTTNQTIVRATAWWECRNNRFRVTAEHSVRDVDGLTYTATTKNWSNGRIDCGDS